MMKLIVADDSRLIRGIIDKAVASIGFKAIQADNGKEALSLLNANKKDVSLVLLDWNMPFLNGIDVLKNMRSDERLKDIPVLMISTESEDNRIKEALNIGAQGYLTKPFTPEKLIEAIELILNSSKSQKTTS
ncbi:MAG: response regulator [Deltaproteobacteria bacterium]|nr:response regulator [Deltaproteobacteria bacterium]